MVNFYRAMYYSAKRGLAIESNVVCPYVCLSVTLVDHDHTGEHGEILGRLEVGVGKSGVKAWKLLQC